MKKHFVTFLSPGTFLCEETEKPIDSWDVEKATAMSRKITERHNAKPFAFYFTTRARNDKDLDSKEVKRSGRYYLGGRVLTLKDVEREMPSETILQSNMRNNKWDKVVVNTNSWKICQPIQKDDVVLEYKP